MIKSYVAKGAYMLLTRKNLNTSRGKAEMRITNNVESITALNSGFISVIHNTYYVILQPEVVRG